MSDTATWFEENLGLLGALPWLTLLAVLIPLLVLARRRTFPHTPLLILLSIPCVLSLGVLFQREWLILASVADVAVIAAMIVDYATLPRRKVFGAERETMRVVSLNKNHRVTITITHRGMRRQNVWIRDDLPDGFEAHPPEFAVRVTPRSRSTLHYTFKAHRRGAFTLQHIHLRVRSLMGLWQRLISYETNTVVHVYPDMKQLAEYAVLARTNRLSLMGVRRTRRVGQDNEFERLRDYSLDDNYKHLDWRATARRNKLTVKDFQTNQSQRLIFMLDCGRMMTNESSGMSLLDYSLNAMLMLSFVALKQGDSVGMVCFSDTVHTYVPPRGGQNQMNRLLHASFDRFPQLVESRYDQAFLHLATHCRKRSLVILVTNLIDEVNAVQIQQYLGTLVGHHLPLGVLLRDHRLFSYADQTAPRGSRLFQAAAAAEILTWRHSVLADLERSGVRSLDVFPEDMTAPLVNQYLEFKARHLL